MEKYEALYHYFSNIKPSFWQLPSVSDSLYLKLKKFTHFGLFNKDYQLMIGAAKILSALGESKDRSLHNFQHGLAASPCCNEKWQIQHGQHCSCLYVWKPIILRSKGIKPQMCVFGYHFL